MKKKLGKNLIKNFSLVIVSGGTVKRKTTKIYSGDEVSALQKPNLRRKSLFSMIAR